MSTVYDVNLSNQPWVLYWCPYGCLWLNLSNLGQESNLAGSTIHSRTLQVVENSFYLFLGNSSTPSTETDQFFATNKRPNGTRHARDTKKTLTCHRRLDLLKMNKHNFVCSLFVE